MWSSRTNHSNPFNPTSHTGHPPPGGRPRGDTGPGSTGEQGGCTGGVARLPSLVTYPQGDIH